jgi:hypothetical protein
MQIVYRAQDISEAHIIAGMLQSHGIETHVGGYYLQGAIGEIGVSGFANVHVSDEDVPLARSIIADYEGKNRERADHKNGGDTAGRGMVPVIVLVVLIVVLLIAFNVEAHLH